MLYVHVLNCITDKKRVLRLNLNIPCYHDASNTSTNCKDHLRPPRYQGVAEFVDTTICYPFIPSNVFI